LNLQKCCKMIRTYISIALKYLLRQPSYSILSILGFSLAFASVFFIYSHVSYQQGFDRHLATSDRVYRLSGEINLPANENIHGLLGPRLGPVMKEEIPAIRQMTRLVPFREKCIVNAHEQVFFEEQVYYADSTVFEVFPLNFLQGSPEHNLADGGQVVISESIARKYFGSTDVLGQPLKLNNSMDFQITGVTEDLPENVHHKMHILISMKSLIPELQQNLELEESENYWRPFVYNFILLGEKNQIAEVEAAFPAFYDKYMAEFGEFLKADFRMIFTALPDLHFTPQFAYDLPKGNRSYSYLLITAGIFLLLIALLNYSNLLSASMAARTRSLGIFKINGAERSHVYKLLITESLIIIASSAAIAWFLLTGVEKQFRELLGGALQGTGFRTGSFLLLMLLVISAIALFFLFSVITKVYRRPINLLSGASGQGPGRRPYGLGKVSIILQFTLSVILIISSLLITRQVQYMLKADTGYRSDHIVQVPLHAERVPMEKLVSFKEEIRRSPLVQGAAFSSNIPGESLGTSHFKLDVDGQEASKIIHILAIDADYIPLLGMEFLEGRNYDPNRPADATGGMILNEACIDFLGLGDSLVGKRIRDIEVIGVLKNGKFNSLHADTRPIVFSHAISPRGYLIIKLNTGDVHGALGFIEETYRSFFDQIPFTYSFMDATMEEIYRNDINQSKLLGLFTLLSIIIANIGLFGLVALLNRTRIREIGIRKVNGARKWQITWLLGRQLLLWVGIAVLLAIPVTWYVTRLWLQNFANRIGFDWWIIPLGGLIILCTAILTTSFITLRAANRNPTETLRYE
jgi:putative ABC transport system permease protein